MNLQIRRAYRDDFIEVFELLKQLWPDKELNKLKLQEVFAKALDSENQQMIISEVDSQIVGFCSLTIKNNLWAAGNLGHVDELITDEHYRGIGIGSHLLEQITVIAKEHDCIKIELDSALHRTNSHAFYQKIGFENRGLIFSKPL